MQNNSTDLNEFEHHFISNISDSPGKKNIDGLQLIYVWLFHLYHKWTLFVFFDWKKRDPAWNAANPWLIYMSYQLLTA